MVHPIPRGLVAAYLFRIAVVVLLLASSHLLVQDIRQASLQTQQLWRISQQLSKSIQGLNSRMEESIGHPQMLDLNTEESLALYSLGKTISFLNDIIVRSQSHENVPQQTGDLGSDMLALHERKLLEQDSVSKLLMRHLKEKQQEGKKKKIIYFCRSSAAGEAEVKDLLLHSSSFTLSYFPNQAEQKSALMAAARYEERISNQYRIRAREHEKLHFCVFIEVGNEQRHFDFPSTIRSVISQGYDRIKVIIIDLGSTDQTVFLLHSFLKGENIARSKFVIVQRGKEETQAQYLFQNIPLYCQADDIILSLESGDEVIGKKSFLLANEVLRGDATMVQVNSLSIVEGYLKKQIAQITLKPEEARKNPQRFDHSFYFFKAAAFLQIKEADLKHNEQWLLGASAYIVPMVEMACSKLTFLGEFMILTNRNGSKSSSSSAEQIKQKQAYHCRKSK